MTVSDMVTEGEFSDELKADTQRWAECIVGAIDADQYANLMREAGFVAVEVREKVDGEAIVARQPGMPRLFSAQIVASKPS